MNLSICYFALYKTVFVVKVYFKVKINKVREIGPISADAKQSYQPVIIFTVTISGLGPKTGPGILHLQVSSLEFI